MQCACEGRRHRGRMCPHGDIPPLGVCHGVGGLYACSVPVRAGDTGGGCVPMGTSPPLGVCHGVGGLYACSVPVRAGDTVGGVPMCYGGPALTGTCVQCAL